MDLSERDMVYIYLGPAPSVSMCRSVGEVRWGEVLVWGRYEVCWAGRPSRQRPRRACLIVFCAEGGAIAV